MKVVEVRFEDRIYPPHNRRGTDLLRTTHENDIGNQVLVDTLTETDNGILAAKTVEVDGKKTTYRKLYSWMGVSEVTYEPETVLPKPK